MNYLITINKFTNYIILIFIIIIIFTNNLFSKDNKILFELNNKVFTKVDLEKRLIYLNFVSDTAELTNNVILNDYISTNIFYEYYLGLNYKIENNDEILKIFNNIKKNNNTKAEEIDIYKEDILKNLGLDLIRKSILENIVNSQKERFRKNNKDIDLLYKFTIKYFNFKYDDINSIQKIIEKDNINFENILNYLNNNQIEYFFKENEILNIDNINEDIRKKILNNEKLFLIEKPNNNYSLIFITKKFETFDGIIADLVSFAVNEKNIDNFENLKCENLLKENQTLNKFTRKEYKFIDLNSKLKDNLININDYIKINNNDEVIFIFLCDIKFDKQILKNNNFNKIITTNVELIEKEFIEKYSKKYKLIKYYE